MSVTFIDFPIPIPNAYTSSCILIVDRFTNERRFHTKETIHLPRLARLLVNTDSVGFRKRSFLKPHFVGVKKSLSISLVNLLQDGSKHSCYKLMSAFLAIKQLCKTTKQSDFCGFVCYSNPNMIRIFWFMDSLLLNC